MYFAKEFSRMTSNSYINEKKVDRIYLLKRQINKPLDSELVKLYLPQTHESKRAFRLTIPVFARISNLNLISIVFIEVLLGIYSIYLMLTLLFSINQHAKSSFWFCLAFCFTPLLKFAFFDELFFDGFVIFFVLSLLVSKKVILGFPLTILTCFTDERGYMCIVFALFYFIVEQIILKNTKNNKLIISVFLGLIFSVFLRLSLSHFYGLTIPIGDNNLVGISVINEHFTALPLYINTCFESFWIAIPIGIAYLFKNNMPFWAIMYSFLTVLLLISISLVLDVTRSGLYGFPLILLGMMIFFHFSEKSNLTYLSKLFALLCFVQPSTLVIIGLIRWMSILHYTKYIKFINNILQ